MAISSRLSRRGDYGKARPAVIIQSDWLGGTDSVLVALMTSSLADAPLYRLTVAPGESNGPRMHSQIMADKIVAMSRGKCGRIIGRLDQAQLIALNHMLSVMIGLAD